jgi:hypothetical protein
LRFVTGERERIERGGLAAGRRPDIAKDFPGALHYGFSSCFYCHCERSDLSAVAQRAKAEAIHSIIAHTVMPRECGASSTPWLIGLIIGVSGILDPRLRGDDK